MRTTSGESTRKLIPPRRVTARALCVAALCCSYWLSFAPQARAQTGAVRAPVPLIEIGPRGAVRLDGRPAGTHRRTATLTNRLAGIFRRRTVGATAEGTGQTVIIKAPTPTRYNVIARVVEAARKAGAGPVRFVSNAEELRRARRELESASSADLPPESLDPLNDPDIPKEASLIVVVAPDNKVYLRRIPVPLGELEATVRSLTRDAPEAGRVVYVSSHINAPYKLVVEVIDAIKRAGVKQIGLVANRRVPR